MFQTSQTPQIGDNGYNYYTYGLGATWRVETPSFSVLYRIIEPHWDEDNEYQSFTVAVESPQGVQLREMTLDRLNYLLDHSLDVVQLDVGELVLLPLMKDEVERYYQKIVRERAKRKKESNAKLKAHAEYQALLGEEKLLVSAWIQASYKGDENEIALKNRVSELAKKRKEIFSALEINSADLIIESECETCSEKGITAKGRICACAKAQAQYIKAYCAAERRVRQAVKWN